ncbi:MAG: glucan biosynthesis protein, partial [Bacteroidota bacterium]
GLIAFVLLLLIKILLEDNIVVHFSEAIVKLTNLWAWILTIFGFASQYLNRKSTAVMYANRAVYPFYILHQTIIIIIGFYLYEKDWGLMIKFPIILIGTFVGSFLIYELLIKRIKWLWPLFGLKRAS